MDRYGYETQSSNYYVIVDKKKNERIGAAYHVTTADRIVTLLNEDEKMKATSGGLADLSVKMAKIRQAMEDHLGVDIYGNPV